MKRVLNAIQILLNSRGAKKHLLIMILSNVMLMALSLITGILSARLLNPVGRGELAQIQLWSFFLIFLGNIDVPNALIYYTSRNKDRVGSLIMSSWAIMLPLAVGWVLVGQILLPRLLHDQDPKVILYARLFLLSVPLGYINLVNMSFLGLKKFSSWAFFRLHTPILYAMLLITLGLTDHATPYTVTVGYLLIMVFGVVLIIGMIFGMKIKLMRPRLTEMHQLLKYGIRSILGSVPDMMNARMDQLVLASWLSSDEVGLYVVAASWALILSSLFKALGTVIFPYIAGSHNTLKKDTLFLLSLRISFLFAVVLSIVMMLVTPLLFSLLFGPAFSNAVTSALILVAATSFYNVKVVMADGMRGFGNPTAIAYAELTAMACTVVFLALLVPQYGIVGAAIASFIAYTVAFFMLLYGCSKQTGHRMLDLLVLDHEDIVIIRLQLSALLKIGGTHQEAQPKIP